MNKLKEEILSFKYNGERVKRFLDLGLNPRWGLSAELTVLMFQLYQESTGDNQYNGKYSCGGCADTIFRKLNDFVAYGDNMGQPLLNWEKPKKATKVAFVEEEKVIKNDDEENNA